MKAHTPAPAKRAASPLLSLIASVVFVTLLLAILLYFGVHHTIIDGLHWVDAQGIWGPVLFIVVMALVVVFLLPGVLFTTGAGFVFGVVEGTLYVVMGSTLGASISFLIARHYFGERIVHFKTFWKAFQVQNLKKAKDYKEQPHKVEHCTIPIFPIIV